MLAAVQLGQGLFNDCKHGGFSCFDCLLMAAVSRGAHATEACVVNQQVVGVMQGPLTF